jgi:hypothetical protein
MCERSSVRNQKNGGEFSFCSSPFRDAAAERKRESWLNNMVVGFSCIFYVYLGRLMLLMIFQFLYI